MGASINRVITIHFPVVYLMRHFNRQIDMVRFLVDKGSHTCLVWDKEREALVGTWVTRALKMEQHYRQTMRHGMTKREILDQHGQPDIKEGYESFEQWTYIIEKEVIKDVVHRLVFDKNGIIVGSGWSGVKTLGVLPGEPHD